MSNNKVTQARKPRATSKPAQEESIAQAIPESPTQATLASNAQEYESALSEMAKVQRVTADLVQAAYINAASSAANKRAIALQYSVRYVLDQGIVDPTYETLSKALCLGTSRNALGLSAEAWRVVGGRLRAAADSLKKNMPFIRYAAKHPDQVSFARHTNRHGVQVQVMQVSESIVDPDKYGNMTLDTNPKGKASPESLCKAASELLGEKKTRDRKAKPEGNAESADSAALANARPADLSDALAIIRANGAIEDADQRDIMARIVATASAAIRAFETQVNAKRSAAAA